MQHVWRAGITRTALETKQGDNAAALKAGLRDLPEPKAL
jgi:hypothetical protein